MSEKEKTSKISASDRTAVRFYFGNALAGLLAGKSGYRNTEIVNEAYAVGMMAFEMEKSRFNS